MTEKSFSNCPRFYIRTYGCQMNVSDSNTMESVLVNLGLQSVDDPKHADMILVNTCAVREHAEHRAFSFLGQIKPLKQKKPDLKIVFAGCTAERVGNKLKSRFPYIDLIIGSKSIKNFADIVKDQIPLNPPLLKGEIKEQNTNTVSSFTTIMRGCENYCSYCIVPYVRGKEISRPASEIIDEIKLRVSNGLKEVMLLGQNVNSYKGKVQGASCPRVRRTHGSEDKEQEKSTDFSDLLKEIAKIEGLKRIRFMTSHPKDLSDKLIETIATEQKLCEHVHLPLQSGSDKILKTMNRGYTSKEYIQKIKKLRKAVPEISITTDILVGFPGETDRDFKNTVNILEKVKFDFLFAFKYSSRPGTKAAQFKDDVPVKIKEKRHAKILDISTRISTQKNAKLIGSTREVLVEEKRKDKFVGLTRTNKKVFFHSDVDLTGKEVLVEITTGKINSLTANLIGVIQ